MSRKGVKEENEMERNMGKEEESRGEVSREAYRGVADSKNYQL